MLPDFKRQLSGARTAEIDIVMHSYTARDNGSVCPCERSEELASHLQDVHKVRSGECVVLSGAKDHV